MTGFRIRDATAGDAPAAAEVMRRSIAELCTEDHRDDPTVLAQWLANKTEANVLAWMSSPKFSLLVALEGELVIAVGGVTEAGHVILNYVSPDARFRGVSRAMLRALEQRAVERGSARCTLESTATAKRFYEASGYASAGPPLEKFGIPGYPLAKSLA